MNGDRTFRCLALVNVFSRRAGRMAPRIVALALVWLLFAPAVVRAQLPPPTHSTLTRFGYYFVNERYGDDTAAVWPYTNLYIASAELYDTSPANIANWHIPFAASLQKAVLHHKAILLGMPADVPVHPSMTWDAVLDVAQNYWGQVKYVELSHEVDRTPQEMQARIDLFNAKLQARGLAPREISATFSPAQILTTNAILAPGLSIAGIEAYMDGPGDPNPQVNVSLLNAYLVTAKSRVHNAGKKIFLIAQGYDRNGEWTNMTTLEALQRPVYLSAYADSAVEAILVFNYNRQNAQGTIGGTKVHPELQQAHREIGSVLAISPAMAIDAPSMNATVTQPFHIGGWAIDRAAPPGVGTGVDAIHIWAYPWTGAAPIFLGVGMYGGSRPDVAAVYGAQFAASGYGLNVGGMSAGTYTIVVYAHSSVSMLFNQAQFVVVTVQ